MKAPMRTRGGSMTVELALVLPVLLAFLFGVLEMGHVFETLTILDHAADQGIRRAIVGGTISQIQTTALAGTCGINHDEIDIELEFRNWLGTQWGSWQALQTTDDGNSAPPRSQIRIRISHEHKMMCAGFFAWMGDREPVGYLHLNVTRQLNRE